MYGESMSTMEWRDRLDLDSAEAIGHVVGMIAVFVGVAGLILSIALTTEFSIQNDALSDLGATEQELSWLFNGTLIVAGGLSAIFFGILSTRIENPYQRAGMVLNAIAGVALLGVGVFPIDHPLHLPVSVLFLIALTLGILVTGYGDRQGTRPRRAIVAFNLVLLHVIAWIFGSLMLDGVALPETVGALVFGIWILLLIIQRGEDLPG